MCGFAGFVGSPNPDLLAKMGASVRHRGPDQDGVFESPDCSLIHYRLSIIDLSEQGRQPLATSDGRYVVAYNGEIYNYRELREKYAREGWAFRTQTDTECFLASAALHRFSDLGDFHGIFAFALWDRDERELFLARDRMGIKPLFTTSRGHRVAFGSEIRALLPTNDRWEEDATSRAMYLAAGYVSGPRTMFRGIESLDPGTLFVAKDGLLRRVRSFNDRTVAPFDGTKQDAERELARVVDRAVSDQLVSDRPVGIFLSGGLDSSVVLSAMRASNPDGEIRSFTTRFRHHVSDPKFNIDADLAAKTAKRFGTTHEEIEVGAEDVIREAGAMARHLGQPHNNPATIALDAAARIASRSVPVVLSGDGGDELFGGYRRYRLWSWAGPLTTHPVIRTLAHQISRLHSKSASWQDLLTGDTEAKRLMTFHAAPSAVRAELFTSATDDAPLAALWEDILRAARFRDPVSRFMALDRATWLRDDAFVRSDRLTMRHGVELRVPLLDDAVVSFATSLPRPWLVGPFAGKKLWRHAFRDRCITEVINGEKRGWIAPNAKWLRVGLTDWARELLEEAIRDHAWMNGDAIRRAFADHLDGRRYGLLEIWTILQYQLWWREYGGKLVARRA